VSEENANEEVEEQGAPVVPEDSAASEDSSDAQSEPSFEEKVENAEAKNEVKKGTKNTEEVLALVFGLGKVLKQAKKNDGKFSSADLVLLTQLFPHFGPAFDEVGEVPAELKDLDTEEVKRLLTVSAAHLGDAVDSEELMEKVEKGLAAALALLAFVKVL